MAENKKDRKGKVKTTEEAKCWKKGGGGEQEQEEQEKEEQDEVKNGGNRGPSCKHLSRALRSCKVLTITLCRMIKEADLSKCFATKLLRVSHRLPRNTDGASP